MSWVLDSGRPIYLQIVERLELSIVSGQFKPGDKVPSVRELAVEAGVNPNTMQKAMVELERQGLVHSERTSGRFITEDEAMITQIQEFMERMNKMGFDGEEIVTLLQKTMREGKK